MAERPVSSNLELRTDNSADTDRERPRDLTEATENAIRDRTAARPGILQRVVRGFFAWTRRTVRTLKYRRAVATMEKAIARNPDSPFLWKALAGKHEAEGNTEDAIECWRSLALIHRKRSESTDMAFAYRKMIQLGCADPGRLYRDLAKLCSEWRRYEEASRACRCVVEAYLAEGQHNAAIGYVRNLPQLGTLGDTVRAELERLVGNAGVELRPLPAKVTASAPEPPVERKPRTLALPTRPQASTTPAPIARPAPILPSIPTRESTAESMRGPLPNRGTSFVPLPDPSVSAVTKEEGEHAIFLRGVLGRVTPFDVVQVAENNLVTGRLCLEREKRIGTIHFDKGRIVAATLGSITAHEALKLLLMAKAGPFTLELATPDELPPDEFHAKNNTTLLVSVLRVLDSEQGTEDDSEADDASDREADTGDLVERNSKRDTRSTRRTDTGFDHWDTRDHGRRN
jgi:tetratricopeptide (TPR) repeat protein